MYFMFLDDGKGDSVYKSLCIFFKDSFSNLLML